MKTKKQTYASKAIQRKIVVKYSIIESHFADHQYDYSDYHSDYADYD